MPGPHSKRKHSMKSKWKLHKYIWKGLIIADWFTHLNKSTLVTYENNLLTLSTTSFVNLITDTKSSSSLRISKIWKVTQPVILKSSRVLKSFSNFGTWPSVSCNGRNRLQWSTSTFIEQRGLRGKLTPAKFERWTVRNDKHLVQRASSFFLLLTRG